MQYVEKSLTSSTLTFEKHFRPMWHDRIGTGSASTWTLFWQLILIGRFHIELNFFSSLSAISHSFLFHFWKSDKLTSERSVNDVAQQAGVLRLPQDRSAKPPKSKSVKSPRSLESSISFKSLKSPKLPVLKKRKKRKIHSAAWKYWFAFGTISEKSTEGFYVCCVTAQSWSGASSIFVKCQIYPALPNADYFFSPVSCQCLTIFAAAIMNTHFFLS